MRGWRPLSNRRHVSKPIATTTTYTLKCLDLQGATQTKTATVQMLPKFQAVATIQVARA